MGVPLQHQSWVWAAAFSPDGRLVVTTSMDNTARVWDATTGQPAGVPMPHQGQIYRAAFSPNGRFVVTASTDKTARVWNVLLGSDSAEDANLLADLAEVVGGYRLTELGSIVVLEEAERRARVRRLVGPEAQGAVPLDVLLRRFVPSYSR
jgi:hypothetical protein